MRKALWAVAAAVVFVAACGKEDNKDEQELKVPPPTETASTLIINEVVPAVLDCLDDAGEPADIIELYNSGDRDLGLEGFAITDADGDVTKGLLSNELVVPRGGVLVLWADAQPEQGPQHLPFKLNGPSREILLSGPDKTVLDRVDITDAAENESFARFPDGDGPFKNCAAASCGERNGTVCRISAGTVTEPAGPTRRR